MLRPLALLAFAIWAFITLVLIQVHLRPAFWRKLGALTYAVVLFEWTPIMLAVVFFQDFFLGRELELGALSWAGGVLVLLGIALLSWIVKHLGWRGLIAYSELKPQIASQKLITTGPFSVVRHPTYLAHTLLFVGIFLMTGFVGNGLLALIDFITTYFVITPMEERELSVRFGDEYRRYKQEVPRFLPWSISKRKL